MYDAENSYLIYNLIENYTLVRNINYKYIVKGKERIMLKHKLVTMRKGKNSKYSFSDNNDYNKYSGNEFF